MNPNGRKSKRTKPPSKKHVEFELHLFDPNQKETALDPLRAGFLEISTNINGNEDKVIFANTL